MNNTPPPAIIFQHGLGAKKAQTLNLLEGLSQSVYSWDCPGHGEIPLGSEKPSFKYYSNYVLDKMEESKLDHAVFGGISMGSGIALHVAIHFPEMVKGLILVRPAWLQKKSPKNLEILLDAAAHIRRPNGLELFKSSPGYLNTKGSIDEVGQSILGVFDNSQRAEIPQVLEAMVNDRPFENTDQLRNITVPTIIIGNDDDPLHPFSMSEYIHDCIPGSHLEKVTSRYVNAANHKDSIIKLVTKFMAGL